MHAKLMKSAGNSRQEIQIEDVSNEADPVDINEKSNSLRDY